MKMINVEIYFIEKELTHQPIVYLKNLLSYEIFW